MKTKEMTMDQLIRLLDCFYNTPWSIADSHLKLLEMQLIQSYKVGSAEALKEVFNARQASSSTMGSVGLIPIQGPIGHRASFLSDYFGWPTTERIGQTFQQFMDDPNVNSIMFDVDSPGGMAVGNEELHQQIMKSKGKKPVIASVKGMAASAAYYIISAADEIVASPSSEVGSIGTVMVHADMSKMYEGAGVDITVIKAGKYKWEGHPYEPLSDEAKNEFQRQVDEHYSMFVNAVAKGRNVSAATVRNDFGQGRMLMAKEALKAGMIDKIGIVNEAPKQKGMRMEDETPKVSETEVLKLKNSLLDL
jgi:signal peptide peptidase SppA